MAYIKFLFSYFIATLLFTASIVDRVSAASLGKARQPICGFNEPFRMFDAMNIDGKFVHDHFIKTIPLESGIKVPIKISFSTGLNFNRSKVGPNFMIPLVDSSCFLLDENEMQVTLPSGQRLHLRKKETGKWTGSSGWTATGDTNSLNLVDKNQNHYSYKKNFLSNITTQSGYCLEIQELQDQSIKVLGDGKPLFQLIWRGDKKPAEMIVDDKKYDIIYDTRPLIQNINGTNVVTRLVEYPTKIQNNEKFLYSVELAINHEIKPYFTSISKETNRKNTYYWDVNDGSLVSINNLDIVVERKNNISSWRHDSNDTKHRIKSYSFNHSTGIFSFTNQFGTATETHSFPPNSKIKGMRKQIVRQSGKDIITRRFIYDEEGRILRMSVNKDEYSHKYTTEGIMEVKETFLNGKIIEKIQIDKNTKKKLRTIYSSQFNKDTDILTSPDGSIATISIGGKQLNFNSIDDFIENNTK